MKNDFWEHMGRNSSMDQKTVCVCVCVSAWRVCTYSIYVCTLASYKWTYVHICASFLGFRQKLLDTYVQRKIECAAIAFMEEANSVVVGKQSKWVAELTLMLISIYLNQH